MDLVDIVSSKCILTVLDICASLSPSNALSIQVIPGWFTFGSLEGPVALFDCMCMCFEIHHVLEYSTLVNLTV